MPAAPTAADLHACRVGRDSTNPTTAPLLCARSANPVSSASMVQRKVDKRALPTNIPTTPVHRSATQLLRGSTASAQPRLHPARQAASALAKQIQSCRVPQGVTRRLLAQMTAFFARHERIPAVEQQSASNAHPKAWIVLTGY